MILITGLGPGDLARVPGPVLDILLDPAVTVIARTAHHPAAAQLAERRELVFCDDLYDTLGSFEDVYTAIADRVLSSASGGARVVYAVPGGPWVGEFAVREILDRGTDVEVLGAESFVDAVLREVGYDPFRRGLQILNGHDLPSPLLVDKPTIVGHLDRPEILADVAANLGRVLPEDGRVTIFSGIGADDAVTWSGTVDEVPAELAGFRTSLWADVEPGGLVGAVRAMAVLRRECPWDREQTHQSLTKYLVEEAFELIEAVSALEEDDMVGYARVEDELGDVLLQVLFQAAIAAEAGAFDIDDVGEVLRQKLVRRHPHVFGDTVVSGAAEVKANWDSIKREERGDDGAGSVLDGIPEGMPALHRAAKVQNRVARAGHETEIAAVGLTPSGPGHEEGAIGEALFALVDRARRSGIDPELALRRTIAEFESRVKAAEATDDRPAEKTSDSG